MIGLFVWVVVGAAVLFVVPSLIAPYTVGNPVAGVAVRVIGALIVFFGVLSTSYVHVPDGHLGQLFRVYGGGSLPEGKIVAVNGENGPQGRIYTPGFHFDLLVNVLYVVDTSKKEEDIPAGKVGILIAKDGAPLRAGQAFADPFGGDLGYRMVDAEIFLKNGGQRGPQLSVLPPGKYRINHYLWNVDQKDAKELPAGFVGVVKSNIWADIDFGTLQAKKPANCDVVKRADDPTSNVQRLAAPIVPVGCIGVWESRCSPANIISTRPPSR